jgi:hypothetical protein
MRACAFLLLAGTSLSLATTGTSAQRDGGPAPVSPEVRAANSRFAGTWKLVGREMRDTQGRIVPAPPNGRVQEGYLAYDPAGYMSLAGAVPNRPPFAGPQPTAQEAFDAMAAYTAYWGAFSVNERTSVMTHQTFGSHRTAISGSDQVRRFRLTDHRLTLEPPATAGGNQNSLTWERVPDLPTLTPTQQRLVGFWKLILSESRNEKGEVLSSSPGQTGFLVYTASGHVIVHAMQPYRRRDVGDAPTPDEMLAAYRSYTGYFGTFTVNEPEQFVVDQIEGSLNSGAPGTRLQQHLEFSGKRLILKQPVTRGDSGEVRTTLTWERLSD